MDYKEKISEISQAMRDNGVKVFEIKNQDEEIKIELFPLQLKNISSSADAYDTILAPLMGLGYIKHSVTSKPYVSIGDKVKKGDVLCVIEKMKVMNEILADNDFEIMEICFENAAIVEFEQVLFKVKRIDLSNGK